uniref:EF-hand domain-containing protein n=1 Tax=Macrostomum lignano TaxID=282301 RepID=A0A1I8ITI7_9PLAT
PEHILSEAAHHVAAGIVVADNHNLVRTVRSPSRSTARGSLSSMGLKIKPERQSRSPGPLIGRTIVVGLAVTPAAGDVLAQPFRPLRVQSQPGNSVLHPVMVVPLQHLVAELGHLAFLNDGAECFCASNYFRNIRCPAAPPPTHRGVQNFALRCLLLLLLLLLFFRWRPQFRLLLPTLNDFLFLLLGPPLSHISLLVHVANPLPFNHKKSAILAADLLPFNFAAGDAAAGGGQLLGDVRARRLHRPNVGDVAAAHVARRSVVRHHHHPAAALGAPDANLASSQPHQLGEVAGLAAAVREVVLVDVAVPLADHLFGWEWRVGQLWNEILDRDWAGFAIEEALLTLKPMLNPNYSVQFTARNFPTRIFQIGTGPAACGKTCQRELAQIPIDRNGHNCLNAGCGTMSSVRAVSPEISAAWPSALRMLMHSPHSPRLASALFSKLPLAARASAQACAVRSRSLAARRAAAPFVEDVEHGEGQPGQGEQQADGQQNAVGPPVPPLLQLDAAELVGGLAALPPVADSLPKPGVDAAVGGHQHQQRDQVLDDHGGQAVHQLGLSEQSARRIRRDDLAADVHHPGQLQRVLHHPGEQQQRRGQQGGSRPDAQGASQEATAGQRQLAGVHDRLRTGFVVIAMATMEKVDTNRLSPVSPLASLHSGVPYRQLSRRSMLIGWVTVHSMKSDRARFNTNTCLGELTNRPQQISRITRPLPTAPKRISRQKTAMQAATAGSSALASCCCCCRISKNFSTKPKRCGHHPGATPSATLSHKPALEAILHIPLTPERIQARQYPGLEQSGAPNFSLLSLLTPTASRPLSTMDFLTAYEAIDTDFSGEITSEELEAYCRKHNYEDKFVEKWLRLFDHDNSGTITIEEFCETLGLVPKQEYMEKVQINREKSSGVMDGVKIITEDPDITDELKEEIVQLARTAQEQFENERDIARYMKSELDAKFDRAWHVIVGRFQYGSFCTHEVGRLFHFYVVRNAILLVMAMVVVVGGGEGLQGGSAGQQSLRRAVGVHVQARVKAVRARRCLPRTAAEAPAPALAPFDISSELAGRASSDSSATSVSPSSAAASLTASVATMSSDATVGELAAAAAFNCGCGSSRGGNERATSAGFARAVPGSPSTSGLEISHRSAAFYSLEQLLLQCCNILCQSGCDASCKASQQSAVDSFIDDRQTDSSGGAERGLIQARHLQTLLSQICRQIAWLVFVNLSFSFNRKSAAVARAPTRKADDHID